MAHRTGLLWTSKTTYVDIDTGEILTKFDALTKYKKIKTSKYVEENYTKSKGCTYYTIYCQKDIQARLF